MKTLLPLCLLAAITARASDLHFSDPANVPPPPAHAIGFPGINTQVDLWTGFQKPPPGYGEVAFYWWIGDPLTRERLSWQLDQLATVDGVMGLQINYAHSDKGGLTYGLTFPSQPSLFSGEWWSLFDWFLGQAKHKGMAVSLSDYTLGIGQGWNMDQMLAENPDLHGAIIRAESKEVSRGKTIEWTMPSGFLAAQAFQVNTGKIVSAKGVDLRPHIINSALKWQAPDNHDQWKIIVVRFDRVIPSYDPMHPKSGAVYARKFFGQFEDRHPNEGGKGLNFFFSDELEFRLRGRLWNDHFASEFRQRKGYDILPELPALFLDLGPRTPKVRMDYNDVQVSLTEENFFKPVFDWHQQRGMIFGCDHGGRGRDVMEFGDYFRTQRWNQGPGCDQPGLSADVVKNKVASSIAHLYQRPRVWLEGYHSSGWGTSTEQLVDATFKNFIMGQNLLTLHGLYYSTHGGWWEWAPPCNHFRMPYWIHMREYFACVQRISYLFSQGVHRCDAAILYPVASMEAELGGNEAVQTAFRLGDHLYKKGIDFDYVDFESIARASVKDKALLVSGESYRVLILPAMRALRFNTLMKAAQFAKAGGIVVALGALPEASDRVGSEDPELERLVVETFGSNARSALKNKTLVRHFHAKGGLGVAAIDNHQVSAVINESIDRDFLCRSSTSQPNILHRQIGTRDVYAVYGAPRGSECVFRADGKLELWDPWTGRSQPLAALEQSTGCTVVKMPLTEKEMQIIVFSPGVPAIVMDTVKTNAAIRLALDSPWEFELKPVLDNRFGDYHWPPSQKLIGAEIRQIRCSQETQQNPGWQEAQYDDSMWPKATYSFGLKFWKLGPLPENSPSVEQELAQLTRIDPAIPVQCGGKTYRWTPYEYSTRFGIEGDPGHEGYHGLKESVTDEFIGLGKRRFSATSSTYEREEGGTRYYLWTSVMATSNMIAMPIVGGMSPSGVWLKSIFVDKNQKNVQLQAGSNPLLLRYDKPGRAFYVLSAGDFSGVSNRTSNATDERSLTMQWHNNRGILAWDACPQTTKPAGWYRFNSPPGMKKMHVVAQGKVRVWVNGSEGNIKTVKNREDGSMEYEAAFEDPVAQQAKIALRIEQNRGFYGGAALPEPICIDCNSGMIALGDWSHIDGLYSYSGGAWYRKTFQLTEEQSKQRVWLDLGSVAASAEVRVNNHPAGIRLAPPWRLDITPWLAPGNNRLEVLVLNTLANHYTSIPTRYRGEIRSGLIGPVHLEISDP